MNFHRIIITPRKRREREKSHSALAMRRTQNSQRRTIFTIYNRHHHKRQQQWATKMTCTVPKATPTEAANACQQAQCAHACMHMLHISRFHKSLCMIVVYVSSPIYTIRVAAANVANRRKKMSCAHLFRSTYGCDRVWVREFNWANERDDERWEERERNSLF